MNSSTYKSYDLTILDEPMLTAGVATPESGFSSLLLVCTNSSLLELRKRWGRTRIEKAHNRNFFTDVSLKRSFGVWKLEISTYGGELKYTGERDELERIAQFLRQWGHETDYRTEASNDSTEQTAREPNWRYARAAPKDDVRKSTVWSQWLKGCSITVLGLIILLVAIVIFSDCSDTNESTGVSDTQESKRIAVEKTREAQTATADTSSPIRVRPTYTPTPNRSLGPASSKMTSTPVRPTATRVASPTSVPTPTFEQIKSEAVEIDYDDLFRNNEDHVGKRIRFVAEIIQVIENADGDNQFILRGNVTRGKYSWDDAVLLAYAGPRLLEDDIVEMVGIVLGLYTYEAVLGNEVTVPHILVVASQRVEEVDRVVITQTPRVVIETVEVEREVVQTVVVEKVVEVVATPTATQIPSLLLSPTPGPNETPTPTATPSPTPEPPSTPAELVERVQQSVVRVKARSGGAIFGQTRAGSGFIFAVEGTTAFIATNHHIIDGSDSVEVQIGDSNTYDSLVLGWDAERDVAVVSICCSSDFIALQWGDASPSEGVAVIAVGYPNSDAGNLVATIGEVRAPDDLSMEHEFISHSAPLNPGNSGGPLLSMPGSEVIGINVARGTQVLAFYAVPYQAIEEQVEEWRSQLIVATTPTPTPYGSTSLSDTSFGSGTYIVSKDIAPGEYRSVAEERSKCVWDRLSGTDGEASSQLGWGFAEDGYTYATILPTDYAFESSGCVQWESTAHLHNDPQPTLRDTFEDGTYLVGIEIEPGQYRANAPKRNAFGCSWQRLRDTKGAPFPRGDSWIASETLLEGQVYVSIKPTDYAFRSDQCGVWVKQ